MGLLWVTTVVTNGCGGFVTHVISTVCMLIIARQFAVSTADQPMSENSYRPEPTMLHPPAVFSWCWRTELF